MRRWLGPAGVVALGIAGGVGQGLSGLPPGWPTWVAVGALGLGGAGLLGLGLWPRRVATQEPSDPPLPEPSPPDVPEEVDLAAAGWERPPEPLSRANEPYDVFVSYARRDNQPPHGQAYWVQAFVWRLNRARRDVGTVADFNVFFDVEQIELMHDWRDRIREGVRKSSAMAVLSSPRWLVSRVGGEEWAQFAKREVALGLGRAAMLPVVLERASVSGGSSPEELQAWLDGLPSDVPRPEGEPEEVVADLQARLTDLGARQGVHHGLEQAFTQDWTVVASDPALEEGFREMARRIEHTLERAALLEGERHDPHFVGREAQLTELRDALTEGVGIVTAIRSLGGIGKTALARRYGQTHRDRYRGGVWELRCDGVVELDVALSVVAQELGVPTTGRPEEVVAGVVLGLRERCEGGEECLIVFDNVTDAGLVAESSLAPLRGFGGLHLMITTRLESRVLGEGPGRRVMELAQLPDEDAVELIRLRQPGRAFASAHDAEAAQGIVRALGGYTLAVEAAAIVLGRTDSGFTVPGFRRRLERDLAGVAEAITADGAAQAVVAHQDKLLSATLGWTLERLSPVERHVLRVASLFPPDVILAVWMRMVAAQRFPELRDEVLEGEGRSAWAEVLNRLVGLQLLMRGPVEERPERRVVRMHRLVGAFVLTGWDAAEREVVRAQVVRVIGIAGKVVDDELNSKPAAVAWVADALSSAAEHLASGPGPHPEIVGWFLMRAGSVEARVGTFSRAVKLCERSYGVLEEVHASRPGDAQAARSVSASRNSLGHHYLRRAGPGDVERARSHFEKCHAAFREVHASSPGDAQAARDVSVSHERLGGYCLRRGGPGDAERALSHFEASLSLREGLHASSPGDAQAAHDVSLSHDHLGGYYLRRGGPGDSERALSHFEASLLLREGLHASSPGDAQAARDVSLSHDRLGDYYLRRGGPGDAERALSHFEQALAIAQALHASSPDDAQCGRDLSSSLERVAQVRHQAGDTSEATQAIGAALQHRERLHKANPGSAEASLGLARAADLAAEYLATTDPTQASHRLSQCHQLLTELHKAGSLFGAEDQAFYERVDARVRQLQTAEE